MAKKKNEEEKRTVRFTIMLTKSESERLLALVDELGVENRSSALRFLLRTRRLADSLALVSKKS